MNILAISDTHGCMDGIDLTGIDLVCFAGDIAPLKGRGAWHVYNQVKWIRDVFLHWCSSYPNVEFAVVPGNHDFFPLATECFSATLNGKNLDIKYPKNVHFLIDQEININGLRIYGTPWVPIISYSWAFEAEHDKLKQKFNLIPDNLDILISHAPPHWNNRDFPIDRSTQYGLSEAFGSSELTEAILDKHPKYCFCGHIHSGCHDPVKIGDTLCYNVSRVDEDYKIAYPPRFITV